MRTLTLIRVELALKPGDVQSAQLLTCNQRGHWEQVTGKSCDNSVLRVARLFQLKRLESSKAGKAKLREQCLSTKKGVD